MKIRKMDMSDVPFVYEEEVKVFKNKLSIKLLYDELIYNELSHYFVGEYQQERVGYIGVWITEPNAEIQNLLVLEKYQEKGFGKAFIEYVIDFCKGYNVKDITLEVRASNSRANRLYKASGFKVVSVRKNYYSDGEEAWLMMKSLEE
jgi:[ribosomal protein S18]-alanine N-acetyltransferase